MSQFPPSISIEVKSNTPNLEILEIAIDEAFRALPFEYFRLECIIAGHMDYGTTLISYDVYKDNIDVKKMIYGKWW